MDRYYLNESEIEEILRGDMSDIEVRDEGESDDENCTEENLQERLQTFDDLVSERNLHHDQVCVQQVIDEPGPSTVRPR